MGDKVVTPVIYGYTAVRMGRKCPFFYAFWRATKPINTTFYQIHAPCCFKPVFKRSLIPGRSATNTA